MTFSTYKIAMWLAVRCVRFATKRKTPLTKEWEQTVRREVEAIPETIVMALEYQKNEADILSERLSRRYDIGMAMNEAANRAIAIKGKAKEDAAGRGLTAKQLEALRFQEEHLKRIIQNA